ncbi:ADP-ribose pyrophosphatase [Alkalithermobacter thermoalcaliphilus JW-YL-7 = DSM 7308]|uniref:ADP-ribose pyrophosphatase n=1 Tax=Alkalithermobacter thermoalcaliphilus JW-YL-7 = DSM 7308 TaxID=1121328 RepID=A0A150FQ15_CLOPD|nr:NUDIX hydrolase [[Clostridium] paradoxum JW-YL-7 = DSM 7308]SHK65654.1 ADP-ribose pyrophosphatase [[Clostridium] paradoxum JW-YL-7 = DSM 7308]
MILEEKTLSSEKIYNGKIINLRIDTVELPDHKYQKREIVEHPGAVAVLAITKENEIIMVKQYRKTVEETLWEVPAGKLEIGEDPKKCAMRELKEETGYSCKKIELINTFYTSPGFSDEKMYLYLAKDLVEGDPNPDEDEYVEIHKVKVEDALDMLQNGTIKDAKTIIAILMSKQLI